MNNYKDIIEEIENMINDSYAQAYEDEDIEFFKEEIEIAKANLESVGTEDYNKVFLDVIENENNLLSEDEKKRKLESYTKISREDLEKQIKECEEYIEKIINEKKS